MSSTYDQDFLLCVYWGSVISSIAAFSINVLTFLECFLATGTNNSGWEEHYGDRSFIWQCRNRFGDDIGYRIWEACNQVFDRLPLAAVVDQDIFCVHGGIPRPVSRDTTRIQDILNVPKVAGINPPYEHEDDAYQQVASDCIWSDPASEEQEMHSVDPKTGYGESLRGGTSLKVVFFLKRPYRKQVCT